MLNNEVLTNEIFRIQDKRNPHDHKSKGANVKAWLSQIGIFITLYVLSYILEMTSTSPTKDIAVACCTAMIIFWHRFLFAHMRRDVWKHSVVGVVLVTLHLVGGYCLTQIR